MALTILAALRVAIGFLTLPQNAVPAASAVATVLFMTLPILALFAGAGYRWEIRQAIAIVVLGVVVQVGCHELVGLTRNPAAKGIFDAVGQSGLIVWCLGIGAALACLLKDRNMLLPIAVFLALFDVWLVFAPEGLVGKALSGGPAPIDLKDVALKIPAIAVSNAPEAPANGFAQIQAYVGPADLLFLAMFFVALYRFGMRPRATLLAITPVLILYLGVVLLLPEVSIGPIRLAALPALLPIGLTVLWMNRREFRLLPEERAITLGLLLLGVPFVAWRILSTQPQPTVPEWTSPFEKSTEEMERGYRF